MLQTLDTLIAFAVIMSVLSLLITIVVQMLSAFFALRGKNLANALSLTFQTIEPSLREHAHGLAEYILKDPIFSDSIMRTKDRLASAVSSVERAAEEAFAEAKDVAQDAVDPLAQKVAALEMAQKESELEQLSKEQGGAARNAPWGFWSVGSAMTLASAVRPGEVYRLLQDLQNLSEEEAMRRGIPLLIKEHATKVLVALSAPDGPALEAANKLNSLATLANIFTTEAQKRAVLDALGSFGATVERASTQAYDRFQRWFGSAQDRAEQWFQAHVRMITIAASVAVAFLLQLDSVDILAQLRSSPAFVTALVKDVAPVVLAEGERVLDPYDTPAFYAYQAWLQSHPLYELKQLPASSTREGYAASLAEAVQGPPSAPETSLPVNEFKRLAAEKAVADAYAAWSAKFPKFRLVAKPDKEKKAQDLTTEIAAKVRAVHDEELGAEPAAQVAARERWLAEYQSVFASGRAYLEARAASLKALRGTIEDAGISLVPNEFMGRWKNEPPRYWAHLLGMAVTAALLSLGAPFWFNLLKNLMSLRPAVATLIERRPQSAPALPSTPKTAPPS